MVKRKEVERFFKELGFVNVSGTNHDRLQHPDGRWTVLSKHQEIPNRVFKEMKSQAGHKLV